MRTKNAIRTANRIVDNPVMKPEVLASRTIASPPNKAMGMVTRAVTAAASRNSLSRVHRIAGHERFTTSPTFKYLVSVPGLKRDSYILALSRVLRMKGEFRPNRLVGWKRGNRLYICRNCAAKE